MARFSHLFLVMLFALTFLGVSPASANSGHHVHAARQAANDTARHIDVTAERRLAGHNDIAPGHLDDCEGSCASCCAMTCGQTALNAAIATFCRLPTAHAPQMMPSLRGASRIISPPQPPPRITA